MSVACGPAKRVEAEGYVETYLKSKVDPTSGVTALLPNGITSVVAHDKSGMTRSVSVSDNALSIEDDDLASIEYRLPSGDTKTVAMQPVPQPPTEP